jgi:hypothetical protein
VTKAGINECGLRYKCGPASLSVQSAGWGVRREMMRMVMMMVVVVVMMNVFFFRACCGPDIHQEDDSSWLI